MAVVFQVLGTPAQQGSKAINRKTGMMFDVSKNLDTWRQNIAWVAKSVRDREKIDRFTGAVEVTAEFRFSRPKAHYRTGKRSHELKPNAPTFKTSAPDTDKLQRALGDGLVDGGLLADDAIIVIWHARKIYADQDWGVRVKVCAVDDDTP